jgi:hypothetical protein
MSESERELCAVLPDRSTVLVVLPGGKIEVLADRCGAAGKVLTPRGAASLLARRAELARDDAEGRVRFAHAWVEDASTGNRVGRATVAWATRGEDLLDVAVAWCSPRDQFSRPRGRKVARSKLGTRAGMVLDVGGLEGPRVDEILAAVSDLTDWPGWVQDATFGASRLSM